MQTYHQKKYRFLLLEAIHPSAKEFLQTEGFEVELLPNSPKESEIIALAKNYDFLGIRSKTQINEKILNSAKHLLGVGCFCIGTDQVDLAAANHLGIPVFNAPYSNTRSVAELVLAEIICLSRQVCDRSAQAHLGQWVKSAIGSHEVRGKTLGIVGYGHIGSQVSVLAEAFGMRVMFYDVVKKLPLGNSQSCESLDELLQKSDFVTLHVPDTKHTRDLIGAVQLKQMKQGAFLINASRGGVVKIGELAQALRSGHLGGAAVDVFPLEPSSNNEKFVSELQGISNVILTPHIGGSTEEAQAAIGYEVAESLTSYARLGNTRGAVNFPNVDLPVLHQDSHRLLNIHQNVPGVLSDITKIVSDLGANIHAQYLSTDSRIGYLVMDMGKGSADEVSSRVSNLKTSIQTRVLY